MIEGLMSTELGQYLQRELSQRGMSIRRAAVAVGLSYGTLYGVMRGEGVPELPTLRKISEGLGVPLRRLQELAGYGPEAMGPVEDALRGLTDEQINLLRRLPPDRKRALIDLIRAALGE